MTTTVATTVRRMEHIHLATTTPATTITPLITASNHLPTGVAMLHRLQPAMHLRTLVSGDVVLSRYFGFDFDTAPMLLCRVVDVFYNYFMMMTTDVIIILWW